MTQGYCNWWNWIDFHVNWISGLVCGLRRKPHAAHRTLCVGSVSTGSSHYHFVTWVWVVSQQRATKMRIILKRSHLLPRSLWRGTLHAGDVKHAYTASHAARFFSCKTLCVTCLELGWRFMLISQAIDFLLWQLTFPVYCVEAVLAKKPPCNGCVISSPSNQTLIYYLLGAYELTESSDVIYRMS